ncbi:MAG: heme exporter protein CcmB [Proteobacteria bacterium]|nr:heme exporter protein CcmB [Pseudomonadota bacterium]
MNTFAVIVARDVRLALRHGGGTMWALLFYLLTVTLFPLAVGPEPEMLARISGGVIWVAALLAALLSLDRLFQSDFEDGSLELLALSPAPLEVVVLAKSLAHWLTTGLPLAAFAPLMGLLLNLHPSAWGVLVLAMLLGTPVLSLIGAIGAALTLGARRGGMLLSLVVVPFFVPTLIFGVSAVDAAAGGLTPRPHLLLLAALLLGAAALAPWAAAAALRLNLE